MHMNILFFVDKYVYEYCTYVFFQCHVKGYMILLYIYFKIFLNALNGERMLRGFSFFLVKINNLHSL